MKFDKSKILVLVGPTSSGKSELAVNLAKRFNGEIISCDSRQIYKGMDLGTGKVTGKWKALPFSRHPERVHPREGSLKYNKYFIYKSIPHHCIDFANPKRQYSVSQFKTTAQKTIREIHKRGKLPILCGGTGHWIDAVVYNQLIPEVKPNLKLRKKLEKKSVSELYQQLKKLDPIRASTIDPKNPRRLIRALEIVITTGKPVPRAALLPLPGSPIYRLAKMGWGWGEMSRVHPKGREVETKQYDALWLGITIPQETLYKKIETRLKQRLNQGMVKEVEDLHSSPPKIEPAPDSIRGGVPRAAGRGGISWNRLGSFGLEYKYISLYLQKKLTYDEMFTQLLFAIKHYSKRQLTWWKRNKNIHWIQKSSATQQLVKKFIKN